jgi:hypothetical protein
MRGVKMKKFFSVVVLSLLASSICLAEGTKESTQSKQENKEQIGEYFINTITSYDEFRQPYIVSVEINEKELFLEFIRQMLDNPDYKFSNFQNDLYYVAQIYNAFCIAEYTGRTADSYENINSSGTQSTYKNKSTGQLVDISTQSYKGRYSEIKKYFLDSGYYIYSENFERTQLVMLKNYRDISYLITEVTLDDLLFYSSDKDAFWGIAKDVIRVNVNNYKSTSEFSNHLKSFLFEEDKLIREELKRLYGHELREGEVVRLTYIYKGKKKGFDFIYKPYHDVFIDDIISFYDYIRAIEKSITWKYLE